MPNETKTGERPNWLQTCEDAQASMESVLTLINLAMGETPCNAEATALLHGAESTALRVKEDLTRAIERAFKS